MNPKVFLAYLFFIALTVLFLLRPYLFSNAPVDGKNRIRVMSHSSFVQPWGAGPEIAKLFEKETGIRVQWINAGHAGLIIERLKLKNKSDRPDVVLGFDQFSIHEANKFFDWLDLGNPPGNSLQNLKSQEKHNLDYEDSSLIPEGFEFPRFIAYDWGPLGFIYRKGEIKVPESLKDLTQPKYKNSLILQDPRMSSPGLQFLIWILAEMGEDKGFEFLKQIRNSIRVLSPSWSSSYSLFKMQKSTLVFSYMTSPYYHQIEEKNQNYRVALFKEAHPVQVEYAGVPKKICVQCEKGVLFISFLRRSDIQKIIMKKNYMYPVSSKALKDSEFKIPKGLKFIDPQKSLFLVRKKQKLVNQWKKVFY